MAKKNGEFAALLSSIRKKEFKPVYFLAGEEPFFIDKIADEIEAKALTEDEKSFNQHIFYGKETDANSVINEAMRYPMMAERVVVILREAQQMRDLEPFESYIKRPSPSTILVVCHKYKKLDKRKTLGKTLQKTGYLFESEKLYDSDLPGWIAGYAASEGYQITPKATMLLAEYIGNDLQRLANELERLTLNLPEGSQIDEKLVSAFTGISREYNNFELSNALAARDLVKANQIVNYFESNPKDNPMIVTLSILYNFFSKLLTYHNLKGSTERKELASAMGVNPFFMKEYELAARHFNAMKTIDIIGALREYDLRSKGVGNGTTGHGELLRELVFKIMH